MPHLAIPYSVLPQDKCCAGCNSAVALSATPVFRPAQRRRSARGSVGPRYDPGVDHCEIEVRYADGSRGALCIWADWRGIFSLTMPAGVIEITSLWFRREGSAIAWKHRGSGLYPEASLRFRESGRDRASIRGLWAS